MLDVATLSLEIDSSDARRAAGDLGKFKTEAGKAEAATTKLGGKSKLAMAGMAAGASAALAAMVGLSKAVAINKQFETSMSKVAAVSGATTRELEQLRDMAKTLGSTTEFAASQAADGLNFLSMAGFEVSESLAAIPSVLDLATAASLGLAESADITSNILSGFGIAAENAADVADVLALASSSANTNVSQLGGAMSTVAPIAAALGIGLEDTAAAIGVLSDAGIQGERAGTALRGSLAALAGPTDAATAALASYGITAAQVNPETHALADIFGLLSAKGLSTADAMTIFGREAASGALVLAGAAERVGEFGDELRDAEGAAGDMAEIMRDNLGGSANSAMSALQGLAIAIGEAGLTKAIRVVLDGVTNLARDLTELTNSISDFFGGQDEMETAALAAEQAMISEAKAARDLADDLFEMQTTSVDVLGAKLALARASLANSEAMRQETIQAKMQGEAYQSAMAKADHARDAIETFQSLATGFDAYTGKARELTAEQAAMMADQIDRLKAAKTLQDEILETVSELSPEYEEAAAKVAYLEALLADAGEQSTILLQSGGKLADPFADAGDEAAGMAVELSFGQQLAAGLEAYIEGVATAAADGKGNVGALSQMLAGAASAALQLYGAMSKAAGALGPLSSAVSSLGGGMFGGLGGLLNDEAIDAAGARLSQLGTGLKLIFERSKAAAVAQAQFGAATRSAGSSAGSAARDVEDYADEIERLEEAADPMRKFKREMEELEVLAAAGLSDGAMAHAIQDLNEELVESTPLVSDLNDAFASTVDYMLSGFADGMSGIWDIFKTTLTRMIATAAQNQITIGLGTSVSGVAGQAAAAATGGGSGIVSGLLGSFSSTLASIGTSFVGGLTTAVSGLFSGGITGAISSVSAAVSGATGVLTGLATAAGAIALPIGLAVAAFGFFDKKVRQLDSGIRITTEGMETLLETYTKTKTTKYYGLSSKKSTDFDPMDQSDADPLLAVISNIQTGIMDTADALGIGADAFADFSTVLKFNLENKTDAEAQEKIERKLGLFGDRFARMIPGLEELAIGSEKTTETLSRLVTDLNAVNESLYLFEQTAMEVSLAGAAASSELVLLTGGLESFAAKNQFLFQNFMTTAEQQDRMVAIAQDVLTAFEDINGALPDTHAGFMDLVFAQDLMTEEGREMYAALMDIADEFVVVNGTAQELADELDNNLTPAIDDTADAARALASIEQERAGLMTQFYRLTGDENALRQQQLASLDESNRALQEKIWDIEDANANQLALITALRDAESDLRDAYAAERDSVADAYDLQIKAARASADASNTLARAQAEESDRLRQARIDALEDQAGLVSDRVRLLASITDALERAYTDRRVLNAIGQQLRLSQAQAFLSSAVSAGGTTDVDRLEEALAAVENPSTALFKSFEDYQHDFNINTNLIDDLRELGISALTVEERTLQALEDQIDVLKDTSDAQVESIEANTQAIEDARDAELSVLERQMNALLGIDTAVLSVESAIRALNIAQEAAGVPVTDTGGGSSGASGDYGGSDADGDGWIDTGSPLWYAKYRPSSVEGQINAAYNDVLGRNVDEAGLSFYSSLVKADNGFGISGVKADLAKNAGTDTGVPAFARGGQHMGGWRVVGENGPELEATGPASIYSNNATRKMLGGDDVLKELKELNDRTRRHQIQTKRIASTVSDWNVNGQPDFREGSGVLTE